MAKLTLHRDHPLGLAGVQSLVDEWVEQGRKRFGLSCELTRNEAGDVVQFQRAGLSGSLKATPTALELDAHLGFLLSPYASRITEEIHRQLDERLGPPTR